MSDYSEKWYTHHANRYAEVSRELLQSVFIESSHPKCTSDPGLVEYVTTIAPGKRGLDAGCGAGARDVYNLWSGGYDIYGMDSVKENIEAAVRLHPEIADRLSVADLRKELRFPAASFDFVMCNAVIQHIEPEIVVFKKGNGVLTMFDKDYGAERTFLLYDEHKLLRTLESMDMELVEAESPDQLGGLMYFIDPKRVAHCAFYARKL
jgi:SAM-dependent methyltransferase